MEPENHALHNGMSKALHNFVVRI